MDAYLSVLIVSSILEIYYEMQAIIIVLVFPPNESLSILVSLESRYGTKEWHFFLSLRIFIQFPKANKLLLILDPSSNPLLLASKLVFSEPAKSIIVNLGEYLSVSPGFVYYISRVSTACDLDEQTFYKVAASALLLFAV